MGKNFLFKIIFGALALLTLSACNPPKNQTTVAPGDCPSWTTCKPNSDSNITDYKICDKSFSGNPTVMGRWQQGFLNVTTKQKTYLTYTIDDTHLSLRVVCDFSPGKVGVEAMTTIGLNTGNKIIDLNSTDSKSVDYYKDSVNFVTCSANLEKMTYEYSFKGQCLKLKPSKGNEQMLIPLNPI